MKSGGWIPIDKAVLNLLPKKRPYTSLEAYISFRLDLDEGRDFTINGYAKLWSWSRCKVRRFVEELKTGARHSLDRDETGVRHSLRIVFNNLEDRQDSDKTPVRHPQDSDLDTTINPNPNPEPNPTSKPIRGRFTPPTVDEVKAYCQERGNFVDAQAFCDHYETRNWIPKGYSKQMASWKAAVRTWEKNSSSGGNGSRPVIPFPTKAQQRTANNLAAVAAVAERLNRGDS